MNRFQELSKPKSHSLETRVRAIASKAHAYVKKNKLISRGLSTVGLHKTAMLANMMGYGRPRRRRRTGAVGVLKF